MWMAFLSVCTVTNWICLRQELWERKCLNKFRRLWSEYETKMWVWRKGSLWTVSHCRLTLTPWNLALLEKFFVAALVKSVCRDSKNFQRSAWTIRIQSTSSNPVYVRPIPLSLPKWTPWCFMLFFLWILCKRAPLCINLSQSKIFRYYGNINQASGIIFKNTVMYFMVFKFRPPKIIARPHRSTLNCQCDAVVSMQSLRCRLPHNT
jgi:hypothetical protein